jgi:hypothetical protein
MILNDYKCPRHGQFEGSHPICPHFGCDSSDVQKIFVKAPGTKSDYTKRFDEGMKKSAEMYRQSDWKTASREGDSSKANNRATELLWGNDAARMLGAAPGALVGGQEGAATPGVKDAGFAPSLVSGGNPITRAERTGVKRQDDAWQGQLAAAAKEARQTPK